MQPLLYVGLELAGHGQVVDPLRDLLVVGFHVAVDVAKFLHHAGDVLACLCAGIDTEAGA